MTVAMRIMSIWNMVTISGSPHETWISNHFGVPTFCHELPSSYQGLLHETSSWKSRARAFVEFAFQLAVKSSGGSNLGVRKTTDALVKNG